MELILHSKAALHTKDGFFYANYQGFSILLMLVITG